jgi:diguanylate cyclase (GGDEF)-like protein/PAS domain S-box-containing protein
MALDYVLTWSTEVYHIHGLTPDRDTPNIEAAIGFYHPDDRDTVTAAMAAAARDGTPFEFSLRLLRAAGELRYVKSRGLTIPGSDGTPAAVFGVLLDVTEQHKTEEKLHEMNLKLEQIAYVDSLTHLANRRQFDEMLGREWHRVIREQTALSLVMLDIDRFKSFNDLYGHLAGDDCLRAVAGAVASVAQRPGDLVARYGGEEFALILPVTEAAGAEQVAHAARKAVVALGLTHPGNAACGGMVTASLGVSTAYPQIGAPRTAWLDLIAEADALLYEAKRTGRNKVVSPTSIEDNGAAPLPADEAARLAALAIY